MSRKKLRDRDAPISKEGIIFRVLGYDHPKSGYICDPEYAPATIYKSNNKRAPRTGCKILYYKFYQDEGLKFILNRYPQYQVYFDVLGTYLVGIRNDMIVECRYPDEKLKRILETADVVDPLVELLIKILDEITGRSKLKIRDFGVFGSLLHDFYHVNYSDIDLVIYGRRETEELRNLLSELFKENNTRWLNEFVHWRLTMSEKVWRFKNISFDEFISHGARKLIYCIYDARSEKLGRFVKVEFEPVKKWDEISPLYTPGTRVRKVGWIECLAKVRDDTDSMFFPSVYEIEDVTIMKGPKTDDIIRVVSYVEEFRLQAYKDEEVFISGWLEEVKPPDKGEFFQIVLTYGPRYYEQTLKVKNYSGKTVN
ncbi:MAG: nucleotidyltransferase domain-containing protein [Candidatus Baldrarchaeia archaeon]